MRPSRLLSTSAFRLTLIYLALFGLSALLLLAFVYVATAGFIARQADQVIDAEITGLAEHYRKAGLAGLRQVVLERGSGQRESLYLLLDPAGRPIAGNLDEWPDIATQPGGWLDFPYLRPIAGRIEEHQARARHLLLPGGFQLLVGRDVQPRVELDRRLRESLGWALLVVLGLGLAGGVVVSRNLLRRVDAIAETSREIMAGDLSRRLPVGGGDDELDRLAQSLNTMLARIEGLMADLRQVTDDIAHDLRTPLTRLRTQLEVTLLRPDDGDAYREAIEAAIAEADALLHSFNALLAIARAEADRGDDETVDLAALARDVAELYEPVAEEKGVTLGLDAEVTASVAGQRDLLMQMLTNLVDNAVKYTPEGGRVTVAAGSEDGRVVLRVADTGPGIPAADRERVLERFVRLESSRSTPGSGLGLSLVAAVARRHNASLELGDNHPGLRVTVRFPAAVRPPA